MKKIMKDIFTDWLKNDGEGFSGVFSASGADGVIFRQACGYKNRAEELRTAASPL